jgi:hypothetical protein
MYRLCMHGAGSDFYQCYVGNAIVRQIPFPKSIMHFAKTPFISVKHPLMS